MGFPEEFQMLGPSCVEFGNVDKARVHATTREKVLSRRKDESSALHSSIQS